LPNPALTLDVAALDELNPEVIISLWSCSNEHKSCFDDIQSLSSSLSVLRLFLWNQVQVLKLTRAFDMDLHEASKIKIVVVWDTPQIIH
jgi:hypothetical protein